MKSCALSTSLILLLASSCAHKSSTSQEANATPPAPKLQKYLLTDAPAWGKVGSQTLWAGGFSGLLYLGKTAGGESQFISMTDRGPNGEAIEMKKGPGRPFLQPEFQPRLMKIETDSAHHSFKIVEEILLKDPHGKPLTGLPHPGDEIPVDAKGKLLQYDLMGIDPESVAIDDDGNYWLGEEYHPALLKFNPQGVLLKKYLPTNSMTRKDLATLQKKFGKEVIVEALPEDFRHRRPNRGFEAMTYFNGKIYAAVQSPLMLPADQEQNIARMLEFDVKSEKTTAEFHYPFTRKGVDKLGDLAHRTGTNQLCTIEQNGKIGTEGIHLVTCFELPKDKKMLTPTTLVALQDIGYDFADKVEGLTFPTPTSMAVINDNDFGVTKAAKHDSILGVIEF